MNLAVLLAAAVAVVFDVPDGGDPLRPGVVATGVPADAELVLRRRGDGAPGPGIFGGSARQGDRIRFQPAVNLTPGEEYSAEVRDAGRVLARCLWTVPLPAGAEREAAVTRVEPAAEMLPANLLKFYLHFNVPMREDTRLFDRIHLEREDGSRVEDPWRRQELWNAEGTRLTLWIHPGRVKRGVNLREELGPVLVPGTRYALVVEPGAGLATLSGRPLARSFRLGFRTGPEDRERPDPRGWSLAVPAAGTRHPLVIGFGERMDAALVRRHLVLADPDGKTVAWERTEIRHGACGDEAVWTPRDPWREGRHRLRIGPWLEDGAGNTPGRVFDRDLAGDSWPAHPEELPVTVRSGRDR